jgi:hypothetical protein
MDCLLTIKGDGAGKYGQFKKDTTRTIRNWIVDNQVIYPKVFKHVATCDKCDPVKISIAYLERRRNTNKFNGRTTAILVNLINRYAKLTAKRGKIFPKEVLHEARLKCDSAKILVTYEKEFSSREIYDVLRNFHIVGHSYVLRGLLAASSRFYAINRLYEKIGDTCPDDIDDLLKVADVMLV